MSNYYEGIPFGSKIGRGRRRNRSIFPFIAGLLVVVIAFSLLTSQLSALWAGEDGEPKVTLSPTAKPIVVVIPTPLPTEPPLPTATPTPEPTPAPTPGPEWLVVANTGGQGAYIRSNPASDERIKAWLDGTRMQVIGPDQEVEGVSWKRVRDPAGNEGWVPAQYLAPAPGAPAPTPPA